MQRPAQTRGGVIDHDVFMLRGARRVSWFFFFQAEDGIRDYKVTGVQTCALPILRIVSL